MHHRKPFQQLLTIFLSVTVPAIILLLFLHLSSIRSMEKNHISLLSGNEHMMVSSIEKAVTFAKDSTNDCVSTMDFITFSSSSSAARVTKYATRMSWKLRSALSLYPEVVGFSLYNVACDREYSTNLRSGYSDALTTYDFSQELNPVSLSSEVTVTSYDDSLLITLIYKRHFGTLIVFLSPLENDYYHSYISSSSDELPQFLPLQEDPLPDNYLVTTFDSLPMLLVIPLSYGARHIWTDPLQLTLLLLIIALIIFVFLVAWNMRISLILPLRKLWNAFDRISNGDTTYRINEQPQMKEIDDFYHGFNRTLDVLQEVRTERDQSQLDSAHARMQYFQLQIRPHFYLNCLKNIRAMAALKDTDRIQDLVILMSSYLRYIFQDNQAFIPLHEELEAVQGYIDLCAVMGSHVDLKVNISTDGLSDPTLPLSVLTFVENSIKHNKNRDPLVITIESHIELNDEGEPFHVITVRDNGSGFPEETLNELNAADPSAIVYRKQHIGISNVRYRLWLAYGDQAGVTFSNEGEEAVVSIHFPAKPLLVMDSNWNPGTFSGKMSK